MFGLRADGKRVKGIDPISKIVPHIMNHRYDAQNMCKYGFRCEPLDDFIKTQNEKGYKFTYMHILMAGLVRITAMYPWLKRFIMNGRIFERNSIGFSFVVKKEMKLDSPESLVKLEFNGNESIYDVKEQIDNAVKENAKSEANNGTERLARLLTVTPNFMIKLLVGMIKLLDKHGMLPKAILDLSPFHTTYFVTNLKSIKGPAIFHHAYEFGTTGMFFAMGKESMEPVVNQGQLEVAKMLPIGIVMDERFCDGFYLVKALDDMKKILEHPEMLVEPYDNQPQPEPAE